MVNRALLIKARNLIVFAILIVALILIKGGWDTYDLARRKSPQHEIAMNNPIAARLEARVLKLSADIGRRNYRYPIGLEAAAAYIRSEFSRAGYDVQEQPYRVHTPGVSEFSTKNLIATIPADAPDAPVLVIGAHYDTAFETPGADDNATGIAGLLELAQELKGIKSRVEIRFVAYSTEEPPFFGGPEMGSAVHARSLKAEHRKVLGMIGLEMLGYYDAAKGSQKYPLVLSLFFPNTADYIGAVSNLSSRRFLAEIRQGFRPPHGLRVVSASLPQWVGEITLSDHVNYWNEGFPAVMITDTAFLRNVHYHQTTDTAEKLDFARMADATEGLTAAVRRLVQD